MELFGLADCNNFYCSCERVFHPDLQHRPVVVLSNNDGCVIARSEESKALGIKMGDVFYQVKELLEIDIVGVAEGLDLTCGISRTEGVVVDEMGSANAFDSG